MSFIVYCSCCGSLFYTTRIANNFVSKDNELKFTYQFLSTNQY